MVSAGVGWCFVFGHAMSCHVGVGGGGEEATRGFGLDGEMQEREGSWDERKHMTRNVPRTTSRTEVGSAKASRMNSCGILGEGSFSIAYNVGIGYLGIVGQMGVTGDEIKKGRMRMVKQLRECVQEEARLTGNKYLGR